MSYALFTEDFPPDFCGGVASWAHDLALAMAPYDIKVFAKNTQNASDYDKCFPVEVTRIKGRNWGQFKAIWTWIASRKSSPTVAIFAHWQLAQWAAKSLKKKGIAIWVFAHGSDIHEHHINVSHLKKTAQWVDIWFPVSKSLESRLLQMIGKANTMVAPMPLAIPTKPPSPTPKGPLLVISRLIESKGIDRSIHLATRLKRDLHIIGDGPDKDRLLSLAKGMRVTFLGKRSREECLQRLESASGLLMLSKCNENQIGDEGLGLCLLEAASRARGGIGSSSGGIPEAIGQGILLPNQITESLLATINQRLNDRDWGLKCYDWVKEHHGAAAFAKVIDRLQCGH